MSDDAKFPDPKQAWHKVLERLYHEDHILYARMNNFSTVQAFLATALAFTTSATTTARNISFIVSLFGLGAFAVLHFTRFPWRPYHSVLAGLLEVVGNNPGRDFHRLAPLRVLHVGPPARAGGTGVAACRGAGHQDRHFVVGPQVRARPVPWYLPGFSGTMFIAVGIPMLTTSFWVLVLYALFYPHTDMRWFVLELVGGLMVVFLLHLLAGRLIPAPIHEGQTHPAPAGDPQSDSNRG